jgi:Tol biopolymer transport system component
VASVASRQQGKYDWLIMTRERWRQIEELYHSVRERGPAVLAGTDPELRRQVERLLAQDSGRKILDESATELMRSLMVSQPATDVPMALAGQTVSHYEILEMLGAGGMGVVYKAFDTKLHRLVALKFLPSHMCQDAELKRQLTEEARAASALDHPNIVVIHDIDDSGDLFIAMTFHEGVTLREKIALGLPVKESLQIARQIASGLAKAHEHSIVHRDIKPSNVIVAKDGIARIIDFGLAKSTDITALMESTARGTPLYMSPEQASGKAVDFRTDLWSLGAVLYEMLTGQRPFNGETQQQVLHAVVHNDPPGLLELRPDLPPEIEAIVSRALQKEPDSRYQSAAELVNDLSAALMALDAPRERARLRPAYAIPAVVFIFLATGVGLWFGRAGNQPAPRVVPLTTFAGLQVLPAFSPDGQQVAFMWNGEKQDNWGLYVKSIDSATALLLSTPVASNVGPSWSPDGRQIAFVRGGGRAGIYSISLRGGAEKKVTDFLAGGATLSWSPDGRFLVAARFYDDIKTESGAGALFLIPTEGGEPKVLLTPPGGRWYESPVVAPSGRALAFVSCTGAKAQHACAISTVRLNGNRMPQGEPQQLAAVGQWFAGLGWTADSRSLVYGVYSGSTQSANNLHLWRIDAGRYGLPARLDVASAGALYPAASLNGNRLAFSRMISDTDVWRLNLGESPQPFLVSSMADGQAQFSPDGKHIAFVSGRGMDGERIWLSNVDGTSVVKLTGDARSEDHGSPRWSPDGRWIAFDAFSMEGRTVVKIVDATSGEPRQMIGSLANDGAPSWSRDGKWIYFRSDRTGRSEVWRMPAQGGAAEQITRAGGNVALESPDGRALYYTKTGGDGPVFGRSFGSNEERQVLPRVVTGRGFAVFDDGIYYLDYRGDPKADSGLVVGDPAAIARVRKKYEIRFHHFASGHSRVISTIQGWPSLGFSVSPDRRTFLFTLWRDASMNLMLIENFR